MEKHKRRKRTPDRPANYETHKAIANCRVQTMDDPAQLELSLLSIGLNGLTFDLEPGISRGLTGAIGGNALEHTAVFHGQLLDLQRSIFRHEISVGGS